MRCLVLNQDFQFLGFCSWQSAICHKVAGKVYVEEEYDKEVHSPSITMRIPAVIRLKKWIKVIYERLMFVSYTKRNVFLRDNYTCLYCNRKLENSEACLDHVIPESRGGLKTWDNTVTSCKVCNYEKGAKTPQEAGLHLIKIPHRPHGFVEIIRIKIGEIHTLWERYIF